MTNRILIHRIICLFSLIFIAFFLLAGCSVFKKVSQDPPQVKNSDKPPKKLTEIEKTINRVFTTLSDQEKRPDESQNQRADGEKTQNKDGQDQSKEGQDQSKENQAQSKEGQSPEDPWESITQQIQTLHLSWNTAMPEVTKKGAKKELIDNFSQALNDLTNVAITKDKNQVLLSANQLYRNIPDLYSLYQSKTSPEIKRILYHVRNIIFYAQVDDWERSLSSMEELKSLWSLLQISVEDDKQEERMKLDLSIYELEKVVTEKNKELVEIKGNITLTNTESLQEEQSS